jgi:nitroreductase / dihydropteridine reductase
MNIADLATTRRTAKAFDPRKPIPAETVDQLRTLLRFSPSSINSQPWHFLFATSADAKERIARATPPPYIYNGPKILNAPLVVVLCTRTDIDDAYLEALLAQETSDGRFPDAKAAAAQMKSRRFYVNLHIERNDLRPWMEKQVYLALGTLLLGAAALGLDACPMEGFDGPRLDAELRLADKGLSAVAIVALGHRSADDWNATLPKSRLPADAVFTDL